MTTFSTKLIIDSVIREFNNAGKSLYIINSGDENRGLLYIKTQDSEISGKFAIHYREYDFHADSYKWIIINDLDENTADNKLNEFITRDKDCWAIDVEDCVNPFAEIL